MNCHESIAGAGNLAACPFAETISLFRQPPWPFAVLISKSKLLRKKLFLGRRVKSFGVRAKKQIRRDRRSVIWKSSLGDGMR